MEITKIKISEINHLKLSPRKDLQPKYPEFHKLKEAIEEFDFVELHDWIKRTINFVGSHQRLKALVEKGVPEIKPGTG